MPPCAPAPVCRHLHADGHPCGSPALRGKPVCFYHDAARQPLTVTRDLGRVLPNLPAPDDLHAIQIGYAQLFRLIAQDEIDSRTATLLLRTLAQAGQNLARIHRRERTHPAAPVTTLTLDSTFGPLAPEPVVEPATTDEQNQYFTESKENLPAGSPEPLAPSTEPATPAVPEPFSQSATPHLASETWVSAPRTEPGTEPGAPPSRRHLAVREGSPAPEPTTAGAPSFPALSERVGSTESSAPSFPALSERVGYPAPERATALANPAPDPQAPTPTLRQAPALPPAPPTGPLTLNEQYILADREHTLPPADHNTALAAITARLLRASPEDRQRDQNILAARTQPQQNQHSTENKETPEQLLELTLVHATAA